MAIQNINSTVFGPLMETQSRTRHRIMPVKNVCPPCPVIHCDTCCPNDLGGSFMVGPGDNIYLQFYLEDTFNEDPTDPQLGWQHSSHGPDDYWLELHVFDQNNNEIELDGIDDIATAWSVSYMEGQSVQNVVIPADFFFDRGIKCFYFCVRVVGIRWSEYLVVDFVGPNQPPNPFYGMVYLDSNNGAYVYVYTLLNNGDEGWVQQYQPPQGTIVYENSTGAWWNVVFDPNNGSSQAVKIPRPELVDDPIGAVQFCCTRLYQTDDCRDTVQICTLRDSGMDCLGRFYERPPNGVTVGDASFRLCRRFPGSFEPDAYPIERTETEDGIVISGSYRERARLRLAGICRYDAEEIAAILANEDFLIDDQTWDSAPGAVEKNNDNGSLWWPDITIEREICEGNKDCDFEFD